MKKYTYTLFLVLFTQAIFSQETYLKSSIITKNNDTLVGYISNLYDAKDIKFKKGHESKALLYSPKDIKGFILYNNVFESRKVSFSSYKQTSMNLNMGGSQSYLTKDNLIGQTQDTVFLRKLVQGKANLYKMAHKNAAIYLFIETDGILRELPPVYYKLELDTLSREMMKNMPASTALANGSIRNKLFEYRDYLDTLALAFKDKNYLEKVKLYDYSEKNIVAEVVKFNKNNGLVDGGILKNDINQKIFLGINGGIVSLKQDEIITDNAINSSICFKGYALSPLKGIDRNAFMKIAINYFAYQNKKNKRSVLMASVGIRYALLTGFIRPYGEMSIAIGKHYWNGNTSPIDFSLIPEMGVIIPLKKTFITIGVNYTPITYGQHGYQFLAYHAGIMF
jgi:hypothetical protein